MSYRPLSIEEAEYIAHRLAKEMMDSINEPIPPFHTADNNKLESSLQAPFQTFEGKYLHRKFAERAAVQFYLVTKNHCFSNGNKRMAVTLTTVLCFINGKWLRISQKSLYDIACSVAESNPKEMKQVVEVLTRAFKNNLESLPVGYLK